MPSTPATLIGVPIDLGAKNLGVDIGPDAFRYQHLVKKLQGAGLEVTDNGNIVVGRREQLEMGCPQLKYLAEIVRVNENLAAQTDAAVNAGHKVIVVGGDHSLNLGAFSGASAALRSKGHELGLIYFDAHGDMNTDETTLSGNIHGMHLASLLGFGAPELRTVYGDQTKLAVNNLLHVAGCDWDQAELDLISREKLNAFTLFDILTKGLGALIERIDALVARTPNVWISVDLDAIDRIYAPGAGMPNSKGLTYREIVTIARYIGEHCNVVGIDIVEYNPLQDEQNKTAELGIELIATFLGKEYSWYSNYMEYNKLS